VGDAEISTEFGLIDQLEESNDEPPKQRGTK